MPAPLISNALQDAPALIETVFPAQKVSFAAQRERKAGAGQTLTALGSYWKGRKPLILVRAIVLGSLLPQTDDAEADLEIFEKLMPFDDEGLARRALIQKALRPKDIAARIKLDDPWRSFAYTVKKDARCADAYRAYDDSQNQPVVGRISVTHPADLLETLRFPLDAVKLGITLRWRRDATEEDKLKLTLKALATFASYEGKAALCKRPEEVDQTWLFAPVRPIVNRHYGHLGIEAWSHQELID